ncbi:ArsA-related P-loop ATPase, partial [Staphylococcus aureus]|uniref:ArsA-related P-loop ATPase n=1 Tax=Staphylococcus aureus TaxID=1280 RepID=UPI003D24C4DB
MPVSLAGVPRDIIELKPENMVGLAALRSLFEGTTPVPSEAIAAPQGDLVPTLDALVDELAADGHGLIMCMGKGGVGKTTIASAIATRLAELGHDVHLTTTDPAGHLENTMGDGYG